MTENAKKLGEKLKKFRKQAGYTLKESAEKLEVSAAFLSMVENGKSGISFANIHKILNIYGKNLGDLTGDTVCQDPIVNMDLSKTIASEPGISIYGLASTNTSEQGYMAGFILDIEPGMANTYDAHSGLEFVLVLEGEILLTVEEQEKVTETPLKTGDTEVHFAQNRHIYQNVGNTPAKVLVVEADTK